MAPLLQNRKSKNSKWSQNSNPGLPKDNANFEKIYDYWESLKNENISKYKIVKGEKIEEKKHWRSFSP